MTTNLAVTMLIQAFVKAWHALKTGESVTIQTPKGPKFVPSRAEAGLARQTDTVITALVVVIVASLAVIVVDQFDQSLGSPSSSKLSDSQVQVIEGFGDMTALIGPLLLVLIAAVIIAVVQNLRS